MGEHGEETRVARGQDTPITGKLGAGVPQVINTFIKKIFLNFKTQPHTNKQKNYME